VKDDISPDDIFRKFRCLNWSLKIILRTLYKKKSWG
jgi:hypothetical protein